MRKNKKQKNKKQIEMNFQGKDLGQGALFSGTVQKSNSVESLKAIQAIKCNTSVKSLETKCLNKSLSKKSTKGKVRKNTRGYYTNSGKMLFENIITVEELAVIFKLAPQTIRNWVAQGKLPYVKIGKRNLFLRESLQEWLDQKEEPQWR